MTEYLDKLLMLLALVEDRPYAKCTKAAVKQLIKEEEDAFRSQEKKN